MKDLCEFLIDHLILDFDGEVNQDTIVGLLGDDQSPLAQTLRGRILQEGGTDDFLLVLCDCLRDSLRPGMNAARVEKQIGIYVES